MNTQSIKYYEDDLTPVAVANIRPFQITATNPEKPLHSLSIITVKQVTNRVVEFVRAGSVRKIGDRYFYTGFEPARLRVPSLKVLPTEMKPGEPTEAPKKPRVAKSKAVKEEALAV
jgi:hypothetical protein